MAREKTSGELFLERIDKMLDKEKELPSLYDIFDVLYKYYPYVFEDYASDFIDQKQRERRLHGVSKPI